MFKRLFYYLKKLINRPKVVNPSEYTAACQDRRQVPQTSLIDEQV